MKIRNGSGEAGTVGILNVGEGDTKLSFDPNNPAERIRAARIVKDMIRRGYALLIEIERNGEKVFVRATDFQEDVCEYVIADFDPLQAQDADHAEKQEPETHNEASAAGKPRGVTRRRVKAESVRSVAVAPSAGG